MLEDMQIPGLDGGPGPKPRAPLPQGPGQTPLTPDEYRRQVQALQEANPHAFDDLRVAAESTGVANVPRATPSASIRPLDALGRGAVEGINQGSDAVVGLGGWVYKKILGAVAHVPGIKDMKTFQDNHQEFLDWYDAGRTSDINPLQIPDNITKKMFGDPQAGLGGFIEGIGQVGIGLLATGGLSLEGSVAGKIAQQGALIDGAFFDPYQKRLSNLIENSHLPMAHEIGTFMASDPSDNEAVGRLKSVLEGGLTGAALGKVLHSLNAMRLQAFAKAGKFIGGSRQAAEEAIRSELSKATDAAPNPSDAVQVVEHPDGTADVVPSTPQALNTPVVGTGHVAMPAHDFLDAVRQPLQNGEVRANTDGTPALRVVMAPKGGTVVELKSLENLTPGDRQGIATQEMQRITNLADANGVTLTLQASPFGENPMPREALRDFYRKFGFEQTKAGDANMTRAPGAVQNGYREIPTSPDALKFASPGEAQTFAASTNDAVRNASLPRATVEPDMLSAIKDRAKALVNAHSLDEANSILDQWGTDFNFSRSSTPIEAKAQIEAMSQVMPNTTAIARAIGKQPHEVTAALAQQIYDGKDAGEALILAKKAFGDTKDLPQILLATRMRLYSISKDVSRLSSLVDANPENSVAMGQLTTALDNLWEFHSNTAGSASNVARTLDAQKIDPEPLLVKGAGETAGTEGDAVAKAASDALDPRNPEQQVEAVQRQVQKAAKTTEGEAPAVSPDAAATPTTEELAAQQAAKDAGKGATPPKSPTSPGTGITSGLTKRELRGLARQIRLNGDNPEGVLNALIATRAGKIAKGDPSLWMKVLGFRMNTMLSGPKTLAVNAMSNAMAALQQPVEMWWAGVRSSDPELRSFGANLMTGLGSEFLDSFRAASKSFSVGENLLDRSSAFEDKTAEMAAQSGKTWLQTLINTPSRVLMTTDEFFKQLNYRSHVRAQALADAENLGLTRLPDAADRVANHVSDTMDGAFTLNGQSGATNPNALNYARVGTFTNPLESGMGKSLQDAALKHPMVRLVVPFVRTPVNLFRWTWERTPGLARFSEVYKSDIAAGGQRAAIAQSKVELGTALYSASVLAALSGQVTGAGPSDPVLRKQWLQAGNEPYSFKIPLTDKWVSYRRADPVLSPVGLAAGMMDNVKGVGNQLLSETRIRNMQRGDGSDGQHPVGNWLGMIADFTHASGDIAAEDGGKIATSFIASAAANISSKTFLQGMVEFFDAVAGNDPNKVQHLVNSTLGSFVPNVLRQVGPDDTMRESRGLLQELLNRTPWSGHLEPQRNIFGEPVLRAPGYLNRNFNPFTVTSKPADPTVADELVKLGRGMTMPDEKRLGGAVDLTDRSRWFDPKTTDAARKNQSPYDRMLDIMAHPGSNMPSLRDALTKLVKSDQWAKMSDGTAAQPGGIKYQLASQLIGQYQDMAYARIKGEYPLLGRALATEDAQKTAAALQGEAGVAAVQKLFQSHR